MTINAGRATRFSRGTVLKEGPTPVPTERNDCAAIQRASGRFVLFP